MPQGSDNRTAATRGLQILVSSPSDIIFPLEKTARCQWKNRSRCVEAATKQFRRPATGDYHPFFFASGHAGRTALARNVCSTGSGPQLKAEFGGWDHYSVDLMMSTVGARGCRQSRGVVKSGGRFEMISYVLRNWSSVNDGAGGHPADRVRCPLPNAVNPEWSRRSAHHIVRPANAALTGGTALGQCFFAKAKSCSPSSLLQWIWISAVSGIPGPVCLNSSYPLSSSSFCHGLNTCRSDESSGILSRRHTKSVWFNPMTIFMRQCVSPYAAFGNPQAARRI
jgi:hypothetical protein